MNSIHELAKVSVEEEFQIPLDELPKREMTISQLKKIICEQMGSLSESDLKALAKALPEIKVGAKMVYGSRFISKASEMEQLILDNIKNYRKEGLTQGVREVFIVCSSFDLIKEAFHWEVQ